MAIEINVYAVEQSTLGLDISIKDETGSLTVPTTDITWKLIDEAGEVINNHSAETVAAASQFTIVLKGDDLAAGSKALKNIYLTLWTTYDSSLGNDLPLVEEIEIPIQGVRGL